MNNAIQPIFEILIIVFSVVIHEVAHGYAALWLGDRTAKYAGRLTLNPISHLDPFGSVLLPAILAFLHLPIIGWAKPVPYNPYNLKNQKWGPAIVGAAGPAANLSLALAFGLFVRFVPALQNDFAGTFFFNFLTIASTIALLNLMLALFNLVPIPPLDGSKVLFALLPYQWHGVENFLTQYGFFLLLFFIFFFSDLLFPIVLFLFHLITGSAPIF
ncbi:MAG: site-2 protease family protein [Candidatus Sungbacteria bacterium]|nr:site-2 protease family protein [Candidatus Sungbacteria bacterium]